MAFDLDDEELEWTRKMKNIGPFQVKLKRQKEDSKNETKSKEKQQDE